MRAMSGLILVGTATVLLKKALVLVANRVIRGNRIYGKPTVGVVPDGNICVSHHAPAQS